MKAHYRAAIDWIQSVPLSGTTEGERLRKLAEMDLRHALNSDEHKRWAEAHFAPTELVERWKGERIPDWQSVLYQRAALWVMRDSSDAVCIVNGFRTVAREVLADNPPPRTCETGKRAGHMEPDPCLPLAIKEILKERTDEFTARAILDGEPIPRRLTISSVAATMGISREALHDMITKGNPRRSVMMAIARACGWALHKLEEEIEKKSEHTT